MVQLQNEAKRQNFMSNAWIGMYDDVNSWRWSLRNEPCLNISKWMSGQPNNNYGDQKCGVLIPGGWDDRGCAEQYPFVCFDGESSTSTFLISDGITSSPFTSMFLFLFKSSQKHKPAMPGTFTNQIRWHGLKPRATVDSITPTWPAQEITLSSPLYKLW